jgi:translocator protein
VEKDVGDSDKALKPVELFCFSQQSLCYRVHMRGEIRRLVAIRKDSVKMNEIASKGQLRLSYLRWALFTVPTIVFLGFLSGYASNSGYENRWFAALQKPDFMPPGWAFPVAWSLLYVMMGLAISVILHARGAKRRGLAIALFLVQLMANLAWSPLFFRAHQVTEAFYLIVFLIVSAGAATIIFARIRRTAALLMLPYLLWLCFAATLNYAVDTLNPNAETLVIPAPALRTQI